MNKPAKPGRRKKANANGRSRAGGPYFSQAVERALLVLDFIRENQRPVSLQQVIDAIGVSKASAFRLLHTLVTLEYVAKADDGLFSTPSGGSHLFASRMVQRMLCAGPALIERLAMEFGETASLAAVFDHHIEVLAVKESPHLVRMVNTPGRILPPNASSMGKAITAFQRPENAEKLIGSYGLYAFTPHTITDPKELQREFQRIRTQGYAEDREESTAGGMCFAVPIRRSNGFAVGAVSLSLPLIRFQGASQAETVIAAIRETVLRMQNVTVDC